MTTSPDAQPAPSFKRCIVLCNPASTNADQVQKRIRRLERALHEISPAASLEVIELKPRSEQDCAGLLLSISSKLGPETLLAIGAGDGTVNSVVQAFMKAPLPPAVRQSPLLPLWGGNANDLAHMLNGPAYRASFRNILQNGRVAAIHPLECTLKTPKDGRTTYYASNYASFGATAFAAQKLNEPEHRSSLLRRIPGGRGLQEVLTVASALIESRAFKVEENGKPSVIYERTFANGSRMGKLSRLPIRLNDRGFYAASFRDKKFVSILPQLFDVMWELAAKRWLKYSHSSFTVAEHTYAQFDGEAVEVQAGTKVSVQLSATPFYALSTQLK